MHYFSRLLVVEVSELSVIAEGPSWSDSQFAIAISELDMAVRNDWRAIAVMLAAMKSRSRGVAKLLD